MKTFVSLNIDYDHVQETGVVVFQAENEEAAVMAVAEEMAGDDEIQDFLENGEEGDEVTDYIFMDMFDEHPVMVKEIELGLSYEDAKNEEFGCWYMADLVPLFENKFKK